MRSWEHYAHGADIGVRGIGDSIEEAFTAGAEALMAVLLADPNRAAPRERVDVRCHAPDLELLFVDWLNALVYEMAVRRMVFSRFNVRVAEGTTLESTVWGEPLDRARHEGRVEVKGATYTTLRVERRADGTWVAQTIVDV